MRGAFVRRAFGAAAALGAALAVARCASPGVPPGGPEDNSPPQLLSVTPDTNATNVKARQIEFVFDEVVSEVPVSGRGGGGVAAGGGSYTGSTGGPSLATIMLLSPRTGALRVDWHRERVTAQPRGGLRPNTTYTLTLLPGLSDLRNNVRDSAIVVVFSTGPTIARNRLGGVVFDWITGKPAAYAVVEAVAADSTTYVALADSTGRFVVPNLPNEAFLVRGVIDANGNRAFDPREAFDTVRVSTALLARGDSAHIELLAFPHDTVGARVSTVAVVDSVTLRLTFDRPLDPTQPITADRFRLATRDSVAVPILSAQRGMDFDSAAARRERARADSVARADTSAAARRDAARRDSLQRVARRDSLRRDSLARRDTTRRRALPPPVASRASPTADVVLVLGQALKPNTFYHIVVLNQRSVSGTLVKTSERTFSTPRPEPPPRAPRDTARARADTARRVPGDSARRRPP